MLGRMLRKAFLSFSLWFLVLHFAAAAQGPIIVTVAGGGGPPPTEGQANNFVIGPTVAVTSDNAGGFYIANALEVLHATSDGQIHLVDSAYPGRLPPNLTDLAVDNAGNLYISSFYDIHKLAPDGTFSIFAGGGGPFGDGGPATSANLSYVGRMALDQTGNLYFSELSRVRRIDTAGIITTVAGNGLGGSDGDGGLATSARVNPGAIAVDQSGNLYIAEPYRVRKVDANGIINTIAGQGVDADTGDGGPAINASVCAIGGMDFDTAGNLYIAERDCNKIRMISPSGIISTIAGTAVPGYTGDGMSALNAEFNTSVDVAHGSAGKIYVADESNLRVRQINSDGTITTAAGVPGTRGDGTAATSVQFSGPAGVSIDSQNNLYVSEVYGRRIREIANGIITTVAGGSQWDGFDFPIALTVGRLNRVYVSDFQGNRVRMLPSNGTMISVAGNGTAGLGGDEGPATSAYISAPAGVKFDALGNLYIVDSGNFRVRKMTPDGIIHAVPGGYGNPADIVIDPNGNLFVSDFAENRIVKVTAGGTLSIIAGSFVSGYSGDGGPATAAHLHGPSGLALDWAGNLYIADSNNNVIRKIDTDGIITTVAGNGTPGLSGDGGPATAAQLNTPGFLALDSAGNLYVTDTKNNTVREIVGLAPKKRRSQVTSQ
ncbi:MAG TPA: hypothetical protein VGK48_12755 [Terriglobia bacterium]|jgi:sugar lactone lactonase YvrE